MDFSLAQRWRLNDYIFKVRFMYIPDNGHEIINFVMRAEVPLTLTEACKITIYMATGQFLDTDILLCDASTQPCRRKLLR
jgi:hypothetical protein